MDQPKNDVSFHLNPSQNPSRDDEPTKSQIPGPVLWLICLVLFGIVIVMNQFVGRASPTPPDPAAILAPDITDPFTMQSKLMVKMQEFSDGLQPGASGTQYSDSIRAAAIRDLDKLRSAIAVADLQTPQAALEILDGLESRTEAPLSDPLKSEVALVRTLIETPQSLTPDALAGLKERHGWFTDLALTRDLPLTDPAREAVAGGGGRIVVVIVLAVLALLGAIFGCIGSIIMLAVRAGDGRLQFRFQRPEHVSTRYLEALALFLFGFVGLIVGMPLVLQAAGISATDPPAWLGPVGLLLQWSLLLTIFWPLARGVTWGQWKSHLGWTAPRGVLREVGAGVVGYLAGLPLLFLAALIVVLIMVLTKNGQQLDPPKNPIAEKLSSIGGFELALLFGLMTIWAPVVEETLFRGVLYRHLRSGMAAAFAIVISAACFGLMHPYEGALLLPVTAIGVIFGVMREWRGSLIGCVTAHALHNATIGVLAILFFGALK